MITPHVERGRWWTTATTRYIRVTVNGERSLRCATCNGSEYGRYGDGFRCHDCGRLVASVEQEEPS